MLRSPSLITRGPWPLASSTCCSNQASPPANSNKPLVGVQEVRYREMMMEKKRSKGVTILSIAIILYSLLFILAFLIFPLIQNGKPQEMPLLLVVFCLLVSSFAILKLKPWSRYWIIVLMSGVIGRSLVSILLVYFRGQGVSIQNVVAEYGIDWVMAISSIYFLTRPKVKEQFK